MSEVLIHLNPQTDYEKLLFAERYIKELKKSVSELRIERGKNVSNIQELEHRNACYKNTIKQHNEVIKTQKTEIFDLKREVNRLAQERDKLLIKLNPQPNQ